MQVPIHSNIHQFLIGTKSGNMKKDVNLPACASIFAMQSSYSYKILSLNQFLLSSLLHHFLPHAPKSSATI